MSQPDCARMARAAFQESLSLECLEVMVNGRRGGKINRDRDLANRWRIAAVPDGHRNELDDLLFPCRVVLGHRHLLAPGRYRTGVRLSSAHESRCYASLACRKPAAEPNRSTTEATIGKSESDAMSTALVG